MKNFCLVFSMIMAFFSHAKECDIYNNHTTPPVLNDSLFWVLTHARACPVDISSLEDEIKAANFEISSYMVANRGIENPVLGSFSFFEIAEGVFPDGEKSEIFLGHFTNLIDGIIELDQEITPGKLLIEAMAWDYKKGLYNFYELKGQKKRTAKWFYRGDSKDALLDNQYLYRTPPAGEEKFGTRMRCSACHNSGGPIMKELSFPHNDWWNEYRPLIFGQNELSPAVLKRVDRLKTAESLAVAVKEGMTKLNHSQSYHNVGIMRSLPEILRPLFCSTEINLASSPRRLKGSERDFVVPPAFLLHPLLGEPSVTFSKNEYQNLIRRYNLHFPEINEVDADHMWLTPVLSASDLMAIDTLIAKGFITKKLVVDILMIDFKRPLFSSLRCQLLSFIPQEISPHWLDDFSYALSLSDEKSAQDLVVYLKDPDSYQHFHDSSLQKYVEELATNEAKQSLFQDLVQLRQEVLISEISQNPLGQILEPGFRLIFPTPLQ